MRLTSHVDQLVEDQICDTITPREKQVKTKGEQFESAFQQPEKYTMSMLLDIFCAAIYMHGGEFMEWFVQYGVSTPEGEQSQLNKNEFLSALDARQVDGTFEEKEQVFEYLLKRQLSKQDNMQKLKQMPLAHHVIDV